MKRWHQILRPWLTKYMALPSDIILELPRITIIGQLHIYVENHQGLIVYTDSELKLRTHKGFIQIVGSSFILKMMYPNEILLEGSIKEVIFISDQQD